MNMESFICLVRG